MDFHLIYYVYLELETSFIHESQNGIDCDLLKNIISCLRHILCLVVKDVNQNLIKYCQEYANDSSNAAYILADIEWIIEIIRLIMGPVGVEFLTLHKKIDNHINRKGKPISDLQSTFVSDFKKWFDLVIVTARRLIVGLSLFLKA